MTATASATRNRASSCTCRTASSTSTPTPSTSSCATASHRIPSPSAASCATRPACSSPRPTPSPDSLARHGQPDSVEELARRNCICFYRNGEPFNRWRLFHQGQQREVTVSGDRADDDGALVRKWAIEGRGIAYKSRLDVEGDLEAGRLVDIFPDARGEPSPLYVAYLSRRYQPARIKVLLGYLEGVFG